MLSRIVTYISMSVMACVLLACKEDQSKPKPPAALVVATSADYPPFEYFKDGTIVGFEIDLMRAIAKELKRDVTFQDLPFESILGALQSKRVDLAISCLSATAERAKVVDFSANYNRSHTVLLTDDPAIKRMEDLSGKIVGVQLGSTNESCLNEWMTKVKGLEKQALSKIPDLVQNLRIKRITGIVMGETEALAVIREIESVKDARRTVAKPETPNTHEVHAQKVPGLLRMIEIPESAFFSAIAFPKGSPLTADVNAVIEKMKKDGTLDALRDKWLTGKVVVKE